VRIHSGESGSSVAGLSLRTASKNSENVVELLHGLGVAGCKCEILHVLREDGHCITSYRVKHGQAKIPKDTI
jgi:hypothetical protein